MLREPYRILLVEDDPDTGEAMTSMLEFEGYRPQWVRSGGEALQVSGAVARGAPCPDAVILDLGLPDMDGIELGQALARQLGPRRIVLVSAVPLRDLMRAAAEIGAHGALRKPFSGESLRNLLEDALGAHPAQIA